MSEVPVWEKYMLTIEEAAAYFRIGEDRLRALAKEESDAEWIFRVGNRTLIKRRQFEQLLDANSTL